MIFQLRDSFKELKKRFSNLKLNFLKRNDRTRNANAIRKQLQQLQLYLEKVQVGPTAVGGAACSAARSRSRLLSQGLRERLHALVELLGSEVNGEAGAAAAELQEEMREFERSIGDHEKTLEMTRKLQQATEEVLHHHGGAPSPGQLFHLSHSLCVPSISSGAMRPGTPSPAWTPSPHSVPARTPCRFSTASLTSLCGPRFWSRKRG